MSKPELSEVDKVVGLSRTVPQICGIIVTYGPGDPGFESAVRSASSELSQLIVVDNSTRETDQAHVDRVLALHGTARGGAPAILAPRNGNRGLSQALNIGLTLGLSRGFSLFLLLDQDSVLATGAAGALADAYERLSISCPSVELAARNVDVSPSGLQSRLEELLYGYGAPESPDARPCTLAMTSGLLVTSTSLRQTGLFDESLFLDAADHEFCLRSSRRGVRLFLAPTAVVYHALGQPIRRRWGSLSIELRQADTRRLYFSTRDTLRVALRHLWHRPGCCTILFSFTLSRSIVYGLFHREHPEWFGAIRRGWVDFLRLSDRPVIPQVM